MKRFLNLHAPDSGRITTHEDTVGASSTPVCVPPVRRRIGIVKISVGCLVTLALLIVALAGLTRLLERKASYSKYAPFFAQEEDFDVLFMGSSHLLNSVFPMELWKDYGIVSYNFGGHGNQLATSYWVMENALDYTTPKLMVIDCYYLEYEMKTSMNFAQVHLSFDAFPLSRTKIRAAFDLLEDGAFHESWTPDMAQRTRLNLLWDYAVYHDRWNELTEDDLDPAVTVEKGAESRIALCHPNEGAAIPPGSKLEGDTVGVRYLERMILDCQARGIDVLLTYLPFPATEVDLKNAARVQDIARDYGVEYIDFFSLPLLDDATDHYDADSHLNPSGARKVTDYLGRYITEHYAIPDRRQDAAYKADWEEAYRAYAEFKGANLKAQEDLDLYLMLLKDAHYDVEIEINDPQVWALPHVAELMANLGVDVERLRDSEIGQTGFLVVYGEDTEGADREEKTTGGGMVEYLTEPRWTADMQDDREEQSGEGADKEGEAAIRIDVLDKETGELVDQAGFDVFGQRLHDTKASQDVPSDTPG